MGKFKRLGIEEARKEFPLINEEAQQALKGGCKYHEILGVPGYTWGNIIRELVSDGHGEKWVCGAGFVHFEEGYAFVIRPQSDFVICEMHEELLETGKGCQQCYFERLDHCNTHYEYFAKGEDCGQCSAYNVDPYEGLSYCETHGEYSCNNCERDFIALYPFGCYDHQQTENCTVCDEIKNGPAA